MSSSRYAMNFITKILLVVLIALVVYFVSILSMGFLLVPQSMSSMSEMMGGMMGFSMQGGFFLYGVLALIFGVTAGLIVALLLGVFSTARPVQPIQPIQPPIPPTQPLPVQQPTPEVDELQIIRKVLSDDEKAIVDEIRRAGTITQDSLRFRLGWSKAKVSRILTSLDKMNLIQRERVGKTYNVFLTEKKKMTD